MNIYRYLFIVVLVSGCSLFKTSHTDLPPEIPYNLKPEYGAIDVGIDSIKMSWECSDLENDNLTFTLYVSPDAIIDTLDLVSETIVENSYILNDLKYEQEYYWMIRAFDGNNTVESGIMKFTTKLFYPDWWDKQDNTEFLYSFGTGVSNSQIESQNIARKIENKKIIVRGYADSLMNLYITEAIVSDPISMKMAEQIVNIVSSVEFADSFVTRQETMIIPNNNYRSYVRLNISKMKIREILFKKVKSAGKLYNELIYSESFQKLQEEFE